MKLIRLKHSMDNEYRVLSLNEAFMEALSLSEGCSCEQEVFETELRNFLNNHMEFLDKIKDDYKEDVIKGWEYKFDYNAWLDKVTKVESSTDKYPLVTGYNYLVNLVTKIHGNEMDLEEGDLLDRIWENSELDFVLYEVNIDDIDYDYSIDEDVVEEYMDEPLETMPPIILDMPICENKEQLKRFRLIDGAHRCSALKKLGISKIQAYIPVP